MIDWWAFCAAREDDWSHQIYEEARPAARASTALCAAWAPRWTRILWRCWTDHTPYDPAIHHRNPTAA